ncbi:uncharacterized protein LOC117903235 [Drosophila subobscura]|uniref:uncharacterized protein LOC117903234 n=1 Tax=Drosophila subobscura TaxID=7241 RepID=UPI00155B0834|nr:uncharacterized protein LOC117903234 [Drosophila subobscura]XP_034671026.1 uncharacterized protein LOC117903235 [Drosophila subobscura]
MKPRDQLVDDVEPAPGNELNNRDESEQDSSDKGSSTTVLDEEEVMGGSMSNSESDQVNDDAQMNGDSVSSLPTSETCAGSREDPANFEPNQVGNGRDDVESDQESVSISEAGSDLAFFEPDDESKKESIEKCLKITKSLINLKKTPIGMPKDSNVSDLPLYIMQPDDCDGNVSDNFDFGWQW